MWLIYLRLHFLCVSWNIQLFSYFHSLTLFRWVNNSNIINTIRFIFYYSWWKSCIFYSLNAFRERKSRFSEAQMLNAVTDWMPREKNPNPPLSVHCSVGWLATWKVRKCSVNVTQWVEQKKQLSKGQLWKPDQRRRRLWKQV